MTKPARLRSWCALALAGCAFSSAEPAAAPPARPAASAPGEATAAVSSGAARVREHVAFLARDDLRGRAPGTDGDERARAYIEAAMREAGLSPLFGAAYQQPFEVTEGVAARAGETVELRLGNAVLPAGPLAVSASGRMAAAGRLVFVGPGVAPQGVGTGSYAKVRPRGLRGEVVVALAEDPADPHVDPAALRIGARAIAARDHGAAAFVWWDPKAEPADVAALARGRADDVGILAVACGAACNEGLRRAFGVSGDGVPRPGAVARGKATVAVPIERVRKTTANVGGVLRGSGPADRPIVVVGAHHDHLGLGRPGSLAPGSHEVHNGADDNASGVAAILELARRWAARPPAERPFDLYVVAFGAEEMGLLGSKHFVAALDEASRRRITAMLNFDMVGRYRPDKGLVVSGVGTAEAWGDLLDGIETDLVLRRKADGYGPSDHSSFYEAKIPVLHFFTGNHPDYHRPSDDADRVDAAGIDRIVALADAVVASLAARPRLAYRAMARSKASVRGFRVSLGTIPDYAAEVEGVRLSGVRKGGAADRAGLRAGDVIVELAGRRVDNLEAYMAAFATLQPGETYEVVVLRGERRVRLAVVPDAPKRRAH